MRRYITPFAFLGLFLASNLTLASAQEAFSAQVTQCEEERHLFLSLRDLYFFECSPPESHPSGPKCMRLLRQYLDAQALYLECLENENDGKGETQWE
ncbi:MAG: hypothetical protein KDD64_16865 [Bdellovibrionales bacterium]|nr:hypothetical protein [Bdellovibrionales bacterium]